MLMTDLLPKEQWVALEQEIHQRFGLNARVYDDKGFSFTGHVTWSNALCPAIKATKGGTAAICSVAHMAMAAEARQTGETVIAECDAGLVKICVPVFVDDVFIGVVGGCGRILDQGEVDAFMVGKSTGMAEAQVETLAAQVEGLTTAQAQEAAHFMEERLAAALDICRAKAGS